MLLVRSEGIIAMDWTVYLKVLPLSVAVFFVLSHSLNCKSHENRTYEKDLQDLRA